MKLSRLVSAAFMIIALGFASLSLTACQSMGGDMNSSGSASSGGSSSGGY